MNEGVLSYWGSSLVKCQDPAVIAALPSGASRFLRDVGIPRPERLHLEPSLAVRPDGGVTLYRVNGLASLTWCIHPGDERVVEIDDQLGEQCPVNSSVERMAEFLTIAELFREQRQVNTIEAARKLAAVALESENAVFGGEYYFWIEWFDVYFEEAEAFGWYEEGSY